MTTPAQANLRRQTLWLTLTLCLFSALLNSISNDPILTLNTEMHTARIKSIDTDAAGMVLLTVSRAVHPFSSLSQVITIPSLL